MTKKILITGANGFVGSRLVDYLSGDPGYKIYALVRNSWLHDISGMNSLAGAFAFDDYSFWNSHDFHAVIHCAGKAHDLKKVSQPEEYDRINYGLAKTVFNHFKATGGSIFIYLSSVKAAADTVTGILDEEVVPDPRTPYGKSKLKAEKWLTEQMATTDKKIFILRPCVIYGPGNKGNLDLLYRFVKKGLPWPLGSFSNERSFLYIDNLAFVIREIVDGNISPGIYNIADDGYCSTNELIRMIGTATGKEPCILKIPRWALKGIAIAGVLLRLPLNPENLEKLTGNYRVDNRKIKEAMSKNLPFDTRQGLIKTFSETSELTTEWQKA